jgi:hypothetical protein
MSIHFNGKLQNLLQSWLPGVVASSSWLTEIGISRQLARTYKVNGWIVPFGYGAFSKPQDKIEWYGGLHTLQSQLRLNVHLGGKTALELQGVAHYLPMGRQNIDLLLSPDTRIPKWFLHHQWPEQVRATENSTLPEKIEIHDISMGNFSIQVSSRERAALELLSLTPRLYSFEEARIIMESLGTLRADVLTKLLSVCTSEKTKRLILYFGEMQNHAWRWKIDERKCEIGSSLLKIVSSNGKYNSKYNLFLPQEYVIQDDKDIKF